MTVKVTKADLDKQTSERTSKHVCASVYEKGVLLSKTAEGEEQAQWSVSDFHNLICFD